MRTYRVHYKGWMKLIKSFLLNTVIVTMLCSSIIIEPISANAETLSLSMGDYESYIAAGYYHAVGLKSDGTVVATGNNSCEQCNVSEWSDIVQVKAGAYHTVGLRSDGTVVAIGRNDGNYYNQCNVSGWSDIVQVAAGEDFTIGLKSDGTVVATGSNYYNQTNIDNWTNIVQVAARGQFTVGLRADGRVVATGKNNSLQCEVYGWTNIVQVVAGAYHTIGLKSDGTVVATGSNGYGQLNVTGWADIQQVQAGNYHTIGLKSEGTVVTEGHNGSGQCNIDGWSNIIQVAGGYYFTIGLKKDGTIVAGGEISQDVESWADIKHPNTAPTILLTSFANEPIFFQNDIIYMPSIKAQDTENDILTCTYYFDDQSLQRDIQTVENTQGSTDAVFSSIDASTLSEGKHTITFKVTDGEEEVTLTESFVIDNSPPSIQDVILNIDSDAINVIVLASDSTGLADTPYNFILDGIENDWSPESTFVIDGLLPNSKHDLTIKVKDSVNQIIEFTQDLYTDAKVPIINITSTIDDKLRLNISDSNPQDTQYQIQCGNQYINELGQLTDIPIWMTLPDKTKRIEGLTLNQPYTFKVKARNKEGVETDFSNSASGKITVLPPTAPTLVSSASVDEVSISWNQVDAFTSYELEVDGIVLDRGTKTTYTHKDLKPSTRHAYRIRSINKAGTGEWSPLKLVTTTQSLPTMPLNIISTASDKSIVVTWDEDPNVVAYEIEIDGMLTLKTTSPYYMLWGLTPNTSYSYRVRGINPLGISSWSNSYLTITYELPTPYVYASNIEENKIDITWDEIEDASYYELEVDDVIVNVGLVTTYEHYSLANNTSHTYRVRAINAQGTSNWSDSLPVSTLPVKPDVPTNIKALATAHSITLYWEALTEIIGYDVELDNIVIENDMETTYIHDDLIPYSNHIYRVRARNSAIEGDWSHPIEVMTLPGEPKAPENIMISTLGTVSTITWDEIPGTIGYEIEINGSDPINVGNNPTFVHREVELEAEQLYRIRSVNIIGKSEWSGYIINNSIKGQSTKNEELELGLTASHITDFSQYVLNVYYNKDVLSVTDLCAKTIEQELTPCTIEQEGITITAFEEGKITFTVDKDIDPGYDWTGIINNIMFEGQVSGGTTIDYTVYVIPE